MDTLSPFQVLQLAHLAPSPTNPRKHFEQDALEDLAATIREHGVIEPIVVRLWPDDYPTPDGRAERPLYEIVAGERRYRASMLAGAADIPAMVRTLTTRQVLEIQIIENLQRRGVNELEEAEGYDLMMRDFGYGADELAEKVGKSRAYIYARLKLTALCEAAREAYRDGRLDASRALLIARIPGAKLQQQATKEITESWNGPMSYRDAARHVQERYMLKLKNAPFETANGLLLVGAGACTTCPKNTANARELFADVDADVCTDPECWANKKANHVCRLAEIQEAMGHKVITGKAAEKIAPHGIFGSSAGDYVLLDEKDYYGGELMTARKAVKGHEVAEVMIEDVRRGKLVPAVAKKDLAEALKAAGLRPHTSSRSPQEIARERARKDEQAYRKALFDRHRTATSIALAASHSPRLSLPDMRLVARQFWASKGSDAQKRLGRMYVPEAPERTAETPSWADEDHQRIRRLTAMIDGFSQAELVLFLLDLSLVGTLDVPTYLDDVSTPAPLLDAVRRAGLDPDVIRDELKGGNSPGAKPAPTPTKAPRGSEGSGKRGAQKASPRAKAARAGGRREEDEIQAAGAARNERKAKNRGRASPAEANEKTLACTAAAAASMRCERTIDWVGGATQ